MWAEGVLGKDNPDKLCSTILFLININVMLHAVDEHYNLQRDMPFKDSQIQVRYSDCGKKCLLYREDCITKTHDGGLANMNHDRKEVWTFPNNENGLHCPVRLILKYLSLCLQT